MRRVVKKVFHMFGAIGGGAKGFKRARAQLGGVEGSWECVGSVDVDAAANRVFQRRVGVSATTLDLADRTQYVAIHGREPPPGWREATPADIRRAANGHRPDCIFLSAPCKGFSGLLSEAKSATAKYQAMNGLAERGLFLALEAWADDPVPLILFENVPRLLTRGRAFADQLTAMMRAFGYAARETVHDCGEIGGLGQSRKRCLIVARHMGKVPNFLYEPPKRPLRAVGDVIGKLWMPGEALAGPLHRIPQLQWKTWVRLAFVEAGSDWRSLNKLEVQDGVLRDYLLVPDMHHGSLGVRPWDEPAGVVAGASRPSNGVFSVADPRYEAAMRNGPLGVVPWGDASGTVAGENRATNGAFNVADPRFDQSAAWNDGHSYGVRAWTEPSSTVTAKLAPGSGYGSVADPRCSSTKHNNCFRVVRFDQAAGTVTGGGHPSAGGQAVADPRGGAAPGDLHGKYHMTPWDAPARTVIAGNANGAFAVADPRSTREGKPFSKYPVTAWEGPSGTVIGGDDTGAYAVADPRSGMDGERSAYLTGGHYGVVPWADPSGAVSAAACHDNGRWSVADPRVPQPTDKVIARIRSLDGTWHRPFTTLELSALQSLFDPEDPRDVAAFTEAYTGESKSDSTYREWTGNAVPPEGIEPVAEEMLRTLMLADAGETFQLSATPVWVRPVIAGLALAQGDPA